MTSNAAYDAYRFAFNMVTAGISQPSVILSLIHQLGLSFAEATLVARFAFLQSQLPTNDSK